MSKEKMPRISEVSEEKFTQLTTNVSRLINEIIPVDLHFMIFFFAENGACRVTGDKDYDVVATMRRLADHLEKEQQRYGITSEVPTKDPEATDRSEGRSNGTGETNTGG